MMQRTVIVALALAPSAAVRASSMIELDLRSLFGEDVAFTASSSVSGEVIPSLFLPVSVHIDIDISRGPTDSRVSSALASEGLSADDRAAWYVCYSVASSALGRGCLSLMDLETWILPTLHDLRTEEVLVASAWFEHRATSSATASDATVHEVSKNVFGPWVAGASSFAVQRYGVVHATFVAHVSVARVGWFEDIRKPENQREWNTNDERIDAADDDASRRPPIDPSVQTLSCSGCPCSAARSLEDVEKRRAALGRRWSILIDDSGDSQWDALYGRLRSNGGEVTFLPHIWNVSFPGTNGEYWLWNSISPHVNVVVDVGLGPELTYPDGGRIVQHCFEPAPHIYERVKQYQSKTVVINNLGLGSERGQFPYYAKSFGLTPRAPNLDEEPQSVIVTTLDDYYEANMGGVQQIEFLKIDTEGHELSVLQGASKTLSKVDMVQFEYGGCYLDVGITLSEVYEFLKSRGFRHFYLIGPSYLQDSPEPNENYSYSNYFATRIPAHRILFSDKTCAQNDAEPAACTGSTFLQKNRF